MTVENCFKPGDIVIFTSPKGSDIYNKTKTHSLIRAGLQFFGNKHLDLVHAAIAISEHELVEMSSNGIRINSTQQKLEDREVIRFRCIDREVASLARDIAINLEKTFVRKKYPDLVKEDQNITYSYKNAVACVRNSEEKKEDRERFFKTITELEPPKEMICSELVVYCYALAYNFLSKKGMDIQFVSNPSVLYEYLTKHTEAFECERMSFDKAGAWITPPTEDPQVTDSPAKP